MSIVSKEERSSFAGPRLGRDSDSDVPAGITGDSLNEGLMVFTWLVPEFWGQSRWSYSW